MKVCLQTINVQDLPKTTSFSVVIFFAVRKMMKISLFALAALALVCALPQEQQPQAQQPVEIVKQDSQVDVNGYNFEFETSDGTSRQEQGEYKNDTEQQGLAVKGSYKYTAPGGQKISVTFLADKNGYQPTEQKEAGDQKQ